MRIAEKVLTILALLTFLTACSKKQQSPEPTQPAGNSNIIADSITYTRHVGPLLNANCTPCHIGAVSGGVSFGTYADAKAHIDRIIVRTSDGTMPKGGTRLTSAQIDTLTAWRSNGEKQ